jgi:hypothetical protein
LVTDGEALQAAFPYLRRKYRVSLDYGDYRNWVLSGLQTEVCAKRDFRPNEVSGNRQKPKNRECADLCRYAQFDGRINLPG